MAITSYNIFFYNHAGDLTFVLEGWEYLEFSQRLNGPWNHLIRIELPEDDPRDTFFREELVRDCIIRIYRRDDLTNNKDLVYEGLHYTTVDQVRQSGPIVFSLYGAGYTDFLTRRIVIPDALDDSMVLSGPAETVIKQFVDSQMVSPVDADRIHPGLTIPTTTGLGQTAEYAARYTNLLTVVSRCAEQGGLDFGIIGDTNPGEFILRVVDLWGTDRRHGNSAGNVPTLFSLKLHNMEIPIRSENGSEEINVVYVGGQNAGINRAILEMEEAAKDFSPWNRKEAFVDARREATLDGLTTEGQAYLNRRAMRDTLTFNVRQTEGTRWLRDWNLGDIISADYFEDRFTKQITEVRVQVSAGQSGESQIEVISAEMEEVV